MALYKCPKCSETFIESKQMTICPSCFYKGKLIELKLSSFDDEDVEKKRFNSRKSMAAAIEYLEDHRETLYYQVINLSPNKKKPTKAVRKITRIFKENNIVLWKDFFAYVENKDIREIRGIGTYYYSSLAHLLCELFGVQEVYDKHGESIKTNPKERERIKIVDKPVVASQEVDEELEKRILRFAEEDDGVFSINTTAELIASSKGPKQYTVQTVLAGIKLLIDKKELVKRGTKMFITPEGLKRIR